MHRLEYENLWPQWMHYYTQPQSGSLLYNVMLHGRLTPIVVFETDMDRFGNRFGDFGEAYYEWFALSNNTKSTMLLFSTAAVSGYAYRASTWHEYVHSIYPCFFEYDGLIRLRNLDVVEEMVQPDDNYTISIPDKLEGTEFWRVNDLYAELLPSGANTVPTTSQVKLVYHSATRFEELKTGCTLSSENIVVNAWCEQSPIFIDMLATIARIKRRAFETSVRLSNLITARYVAGIGVNINTMAFNIAIDIDSLSYRTWDTTTTLTITGNPIYHLKVDRLNSIDHMLEQESTLDGYNTIRLCKYIEPFPVYAFKSNGASGQVALYNALTIGSTDFPTTLFRDVLWSNATSNPVPFVLSESNTTLWFYSNSDLASSYLVWYCSKNFDIVYGNDQIVSLIPTGNCPNTTCTVYGADGIRCQTMTESLFTGFDAATQQSLVTIIREKAPTTLGYMNWEMGIWFNKGDPMPVTSFVGNYLE